MKRIFLLLLIPAALLAQVTGTYFPLKVGILTREIPSALTVSGGVRADTLRTALYALPVADGAAGQSLVTDGAGQVSWQTVSDGDITAVVAGDLLSGGGTTGTVTLNVDTTEAATQYDLLSYLPLIAVGDSVLANVPDSSALYDSLAGAWQSEISDSLNLTMLQRLTSDDFHNLGGTDANTTYTADGTTLDLTTTEFGVKDHGITYAQLDTVATGFVDVRKFGAAGDGVTDDTDAIQAAVDYLEGLTGGQVYLPVGTYLVTEPILVDGAAQSDGWGAGGIEFVGAGLRGTVIKTATDTTILQLGTSANKIVIRVANLSIVGPGLSYTNSIGIDSRTTGGSYVIDNVLVSGFYIGIRYYDNTNVDARHLNVRLCHIGLAMGYYSDVHNYKNCRFDQCDIGVHVGYWDTGRGQSSPTETHASGFYNCMFNQDSLGLMIEGSGTESIIVSNCYIEQYEDCAIRIADAAFARSVSGHVSIENCYFNGNRLSEPTGKKAYAIEVNRAFSVAVRGGGFRNHTEAAIAARHADSRITIDPPGSYSTVSGEQGTVKLSDGSYYTLGMYRGATIGRISSVRGNRIVTLPTASSTYDQVVLETSSTKYACALNDTGGYSWHTQPTYRQLGELALVDSLAVDSDSLKFYVGSTAYSAITDFAETGDIAGVTAGDMLTGGGTTGTVTLNADTTAGKLATKYDNLLKLDKSAVRDSANAAIAAITWSGDLAGTGASPALAANSVEEAEINWGGVDEDSLLDKINAATGKLSTSAADTAEWTAFVRNHQVTGGYDGNAGPNNAIKYDRKGNANEMVWIPRFNWDRTNGFNSSTIHPAFVVDGTAIKGFYVAKYECVVLDSSTSAIYSAGKLNTDTHHYIANSQPNVAPRHTITFDAARRACDNMNNGSTITGYHLMTNAEWAAVALWTKDNATMPYGNNNYGRDVDKRHLSGTIITGDTFGSGNSRWLTGSGGPTTTHNWVNGIADMNGNLWEWVDGLKVDEGKIYVMGNDNTTPTWGGNSFAAAESTWYDTGMWVNWDGTASYCSFSAVGRDSITGAVKSKTFGTTTGADSLLQVLAIGPVGSTAAAYGNDYIYLRNDGLRFPIRSGYWASGANAGVFHLRVQNKRSDSDHTLGFRAALIEE